MKLKIKIMRWKSKNDYTKQLKYEIESRKNELKSHNSEIKRLNDFKK